jgi:hypothetical protein
MGRHSAVRAPAGYKCLNFFSKSAPPDAIIEANISKNPVGRPKKVSADPAVVSNPVPDPSTDVQDAAQSSAASALVDSAASPLADASVHGCISPARKRAKRAKRDNDAPYMKYFVHSRNGLDSNGKPVRFIKCVACSVGSRKETIIMDRLDTLQKHLGITISSDGSYVRSGQASAHDRNVATYEELTQRQELGAFLSNLMTSFPDRLQRYIDCKAVCSEVCSLQGMHSFMCLRPHCLDNVLNV